MVAYFTLILYRSVTVPCSSRENTVILYRSVTVPCSSRENTVILYRSVTVPCSSRENTVILYRSVTVPCSSRENNKHCCCRCRTLVGEVKTLPQFVPLPPTPRWGSPYNSDLLRTQELSELAPVSPGDGWKHGFARVVSCPERPIVYFVFDDRLFSAVLRSLEQTHCARM